MFLIWGFRSKTKILARLLLVCHLCQQPAAQTVFQRVRWFTLFFIPIIPFQRKHFAQCALCGQVAQISKEEAARLVLEAPVSAAPTPATLPAEAPSEAS